MASHHLSSWSYLSSEICVLSEAVSLSQYGCHVKMRQEGILSIPKTTPGTVQTNHLRGQPPLSFSLSACLSPAHPLINTHKNGSVLLPTPVLSWRGLTYSESKAEEVTKSFEGHNQVLWSLQKARVITIALSLPFQKGRYFFPQFI